MTQNPMTEEERPTDPFILTEQEQAEGWAELTQEYCAGVGVQVPTPAELEDYRTEYRAWLLQTNRTGVYPAPPEASEPGTPEPEDTELLSGNPWARVRHQVCGEAN